MRRRRLLWYLYPPYLIIGVISLVAVSMYLSLSFRNVYIESVTADLLVRARLLQDRFAPIIGSAPEAAADSVCKRIAELTSTRITVVDPSGKVIGDSERDPTTLDNHADRPEIIEALSGKIGRSVRYSFTIRQEMIYVAAPVMSGDRVIAVVRASLPLISIRKALGTVYLRIAMGGLIAALFLGVISYFISLRIGRPLEQLRVGAQRFARGEFARKLYSSDYYEMGMLAESMNEMASQLDERIKAIARQRGETDAILASMIEGVLAVDLDMRVLTMNEAAARMFETDSIKAHGLSILETARNIHIHRFVEKTLQSETNIEEEIPLGGTKDIVLQAHGTVLRDEKGNRIGGLVVMHDITEIRRLENVKREFVANVSHELKTPVTAIKGSVETLRDGALSDPAKAEDFLAIISRHADRLNAIIDDLLSLSRIEQTSEREDLIVEKTSIKGLIESAVNSLAARAEQRKIDIRCEASGDFPVSVNAVLIEQAISNLIDNAVNYTDPGGSVLVAISQNEAKIIITVKDNGCGIEKRHLPRLFERFYRVDTARSRKMGGTGLGLAIVKHIAQAHGGYVTVESQPGKGSEFALIIPKNRRRLLADN